MRVSAWTESSLMALKQAEKWWHKDLDDNMLFFWLTFDPDKHFWSILAACGQSLIGLANVLGNASQYSDSLSSRAYLFQKSL